ncbi:ADP-ribosylglycohydrolase family protein [Pelagicoccus sp. SDUM812002]|uniref:ADP-ribosylglycohydrolase family protein n=1 Tax=Pelagicoccus sp. SDUM812002 TaxID=3041266 RepID=UPI00280F3872|nr:ADP-ribosylglycohydrolase family protein [Pelagicoccus sp. SDUM812002]MDQ8185759.1 ADP-ribosylglycohydrolase family protein [Pelagicoccus sp. SDUM812002]
MDLPPDPVVIEEPVELPRSFSRDVVLAAFAVDSYCLGPHWVYDTDKLEEIYPEGIDRLDDPRSEYHPGKGKGDLTHYGDQTLILLESLADSGEPDTGKWMQDWLSFWQNDPQSYLDGATRNVLEAWASEQRFIPSHSHDLAGASRIAPLLSLLAEEPVDRVVQAARDYTASTHGDSLVVDAAEFFTRASFYQREGHKLKSAFSLAAVETSEAIEALFRQGLWEPEEGALDMAFRFGQNCDVSNALPLTVWLALKYQDDPVKMLEQNALVGGDSAARGMLLAILIAAEGGYGRLPVSWTTELNGIERIGDALQSIVANQG